MRSVSILIYFLEQVTIFGLKEGGALTSATPLQTLITHKAVWFLLKVLFSCRKPESPVQSLYLGHSSSSEPSRSGASKENGPKDSKSQLKKSGSQHIDEDVEYDDDFNSHRSDLSRSELSIGEEIEEVSIEGPEPSDKFDETTQDLSVSQLSHSHAVDYMEDVP